MTERGNDICDTFKYLGLIIKDRLGNEQYTDFYGTKS